MGRLRQPETAGEWALAVALVSLVTGIIGALAAVAVLKDGGVRTALFAALLLVLLLVLLSAVGSLLLSPRIRRRRTPGRVLRGRELLVADLPYGSVQGTASNEAVRTLTLRAYMDGSALFLPPNGDRRSPHDDVPSTLVGDDLTGAICDALHRGEKVLLAGEAGQGKSLLVQLVQNRLLRRFEASTAQSPVAVFVPLAQVVGEPESEEPDDLVALLSKHVRPEKFLSRAEILDLWHSGRLLVLLDGADEIPAGMRDEDGYPKPWVLQLMGLSALLSTRPGFLDTFLSQTDADAGRQRVLLKPLVYGEDTKKYLRAFSELVDADSDAVLEVFEHEQNVSLRDLCARPLLVFMAAEVITTMLRSGEMASGGGGSDSRGTWSSAAVYRSYTSKWLRHEVGKKSAVKDPVQKQRLVSQLAWQLFRAPANDEKSYGNADFSKQVIKSADLEHAVGAVMGRYPNDFSWPEPKHVVGDLKRRSFLVVAEPGRTYRFAHKSFYEFLVADQVFEALTESVNTNPTAEAEEVARVVLPEPMVGFLRELLEDLRPDRPDEADACARLLERVANVGGGDESESFAEEMVRQQAANLLPLVLKGDEELSAFRDAVERDPSPLVWRGAAVGLALHHGRDELLRWFVGVMRENEDATERHLTYNKLYYGDISVAEAARSRHGTECEFVFKASVRHLGNPHYRKIWPMDLFTLQTLLGREDQDAPTHLPACRDRLVELLAEAEFEEKDHDDVEQLRRLVG